MLASLHHMLIRCHTVFGLAILLRSRSSIAALCPYLCPAHLHWQGYLGMRPLRCVSTNLSLGKGQGQSLSNAPSVCMLTSAVVLTDLGAYKPQCLQTCHDLLEHRFACLSSVTANRGWLAPTASTWPHQSTHPAPASK
jgi:hypothetical protein